VATTVTTIVSHTAPAGTPFAVAAAEVIAEPHQPDAG